MMYVVGVLARDLGYVHANDIIPGCDQGGPAYVPTLCQFIVTMPCLSPTSYSASQCYFEAYVRKYVFEAADMHDTSYLPKQSDWSRCAPCENDTTYLHRVIQVCFTLLHTLRMRNVDPEPIICKRAKYQTETPTPWVE